MKRQIVHLFFSLPYILNPLLCSKLTLVPRPLISNNTTSTCPLTAARDTGVQPALSDKVRPGLSILEFICIYRYVCGWRVFFKSLRIPHGNIIFPLPGSSRIHTSEFWRLARPGARAGSHCFLRIHGITSTGHDVGAEPYCNAFWLPECVRSLIPEKMHNKAFRNRQFPRPFVCPIQYCTAILTNAIFQSILSFGANLG